jgi:phenylacetate-CoA ligase
MDCMTVRIEPVTGLSAADGAVASSRLAREIKIRIGSTVTVELAPPGDLERSAGKLKRVYDLR